MKSLTLGILALISMSVQAEVTCKTLYRSGNDTYVTSKVVTDYLNRTCDVTLPFSQSPVYGYAENLATTVTTAVMVCCTKK
jgi:hypothetical protein